MIRLSVGWAKSPERDGCWWQLRELCSSSLPWGQQSRERRGEAALFIQSSPPGTGSPRSILHGAARPLCSLQECSSWGGKARTGFRAA